MENSQNNQINLNSSILNAELGIKLANFKILSEFLSNSLVYFYQTKYTTKSYNQDEYLTILKKYEEVKKIFDDMLLDFSKELNLPNQLDMFNNQQ